MGLRINTNVAALNAYNNLSTNQGNLEGAFAKLSSGLRINKAADDAAGLSIAQGLTSQINGLTQAVSNANDGINVAQIADGALGTTQDILQRMRTLVVKAGNEGTQDSDSLGAIQKEIKNLNTQLDNIATQTKFGQTDLLDGTYKKNFQVGANGGDVIGLDLKTNFDGLSGVTAYDGTGNGNAAIASTGVRSNALGATLGSYNMTLSAYNDKDSDKNSMSGGLNIVNFDSDGFDAYDKDGNVLKADGVSTGGTAGNNKTTVYTTTESKADLNAIDAAIDSVSESRSQIGAVQNQLNYTVDNLQTGITNVTASRSNLMDADLATQVTKMSQSQILMQASTSVLAQANAAPQAILKLLQ